MNWFNQENKKNMQLSMLFDTLIVIIVFLVSGVFFAMMIILLIIALNLDIHLQQSKDYYEFEMSKKKPKKVDKK